MRKMLGLMIVLGLAATPALAQKVTIDYAHEFDFTAAKTFTYVTNEESKAKNPLMAERIEEMIKQELREGELEEVAEGGDLYVTCHVTTKEKTSYNTTNYGYGGYWGGWGAWGRGMGTSTTTAYDYTEGTLVIDGYDSKEKKMVWRGTGTVTVKSTPEKQIKQVEKILAKLGSKWQQILAGKGK